jgi:hypothetical protein
VRLAEVMEFALVLRTATTATPDNPIVVVQTISGFPVHGGEPRNRVKCLLASPWQWTAVKRSSAIWS